MYQTAIIDRTGFISRNLTSSTVWRTRENHLFSSVSDPNQANVIWIVVEQPDMQSLNAIRQFVSRRPQTAVLLLCGKQNTEFTRNAFLSGVFDCLTLPVGDNELKRIFQRLNHKFVPDLFSEFQEQEQDFISSLLNMSPDMDQKLETLFRAVSSSCEQSGSDLQSSLVLVRERLLNMISQKAPYLNLFLWNGIFSVQPPVPSELIPVWLEDCRLLKQVLFRYHHFSQQHVREAARYIMLHPDGKLSLNEIAAAVHLNSSYLSHLFRQEAGITLVQYVTEQKMYRAKVLLMNNEMKIHEIAILLGYNEAEYFRKIFKNTCGISPSSYKSRILKTG